MSRKENQKWMEEALTELHGLFWAGKFDEANTILENHDIEATPWIRSMSLLRGCFPARHKLADWYPFRDRLYAYLESQGHDVDRRMRGLMDTSWADK